MKNAVKIFFLSLVIATFYGCGGSDDPGSDDSNNNDPDAPTLVSIGNKTVNTGDTLSFTVSATDPNDLTLMYSSDGSIGTGPNPYDAGYDADFNTNTRQFFWDTTGVALGDYHVQFTVMNSAALTDSETIRIRIQNPPGIYETGRDLYINDCTGSSCHKNEETNTGGFTVLCSSEATIKSATESGPGSMPTFNYSADQEAAISHYLLNVKPTQC